MHLQHFPSALLSALVILEAYIANIMHPDQTAPLGLIVFASKVCFDSLHPSQQFLSHVKTGLPGLNQY